MYDVSDDVLVERWRLEQFERMGFGHSASSLLHEWQVDLHEAQDLIAKGCPPHVAIQILCPADLPLPPESDVLVGALDSSMQ